GGSGGGAGRKPLLHSRDSGACQAIRPLTKKHGGFILSDKSREREIMDQLTRDRIRHIFLSPRPSFAFTTAATLLGLDFGDLKRQIEDGEIVAVSTPLGRRVAREEM